MPEMRVMESRLAIVPTLPFCGLPNVNRVGDRECYCLFQIATQLPNIATLPHQRLSLVFHKRKRIRFVSLVSQRCAVNSPVWLKPVPNGPIV